MDRLSALLHLKLAKTPAPRTVAAIVAMPEVCREARTTAQLNATRDRIATVPDVVTSLILKRDKDCWTAAIASISSSHSSSWIPVMMMVSSGVCAPSTPSSLPRSPLDIFDPTGTP